jgi:hypothetical protein
MSVEDGSAGVGERVLRRSPFGNQPGIAREPRVYAIYAEA